MTVCPRCGAQCADGLRFCEACGGPLPVQPVPPVWGAAAVPGAAQRPGAVPGWVPTQAPVAANRPAVVAPPVAPVPSGVQEGRGVADPARAWLRGVRAPLVCMLVSAVIGMLYYPLTILLSMASSGAVASGLVGGVAAGLTTLMGIALFVPIAGDGRSRKGGAAMITAFVLAAVYTGCMIGGNQAAHSMTAAGISQAPGSVRVLYAVSIVGGGLMPLIMIVLVMVMTRSVPVDPMAVPTPAAQSMKTAKPHGVGARVAVLVACIVVVVCDLIVCVLYQGPLLLRGPVLGGLYSAVNAIMFVLAVMLPLVALAGRLRETTGVNCRVAVLVAMVVCSLAQVVSLSCTIGKLWMVGQTMEWKLSRDEYYDKYASLDFANTVMGVVFYLTIIVTVVIMLVVVSKAMRGVSGPARPAAYAPAPAAYATPASPSPLPPSAPAAAPVPGAMPAPLPAGRSAPAPSGRPPYPRR